MFRQLRFYAWINTRRSENNIISDFTTTIGGKEDVLICCGDWSATKNLPGWQPGPKGANTRAMFRRHGFDVVLIDEFRTSITCSVCGEVSMQKFIKKEGETNLVHKIIACASCGVVLDRDKNAATNITNIAAMTMRMEDRPFQMQPFRPKTFVNRHGYTHCEPPTEEYTNWKATRKRPDPPDAGWIPAAFNHTPSATEAPEQVTAEWLQQAVKFDKCAEMIKTGYPQHQKTNAQLNAMRKSEDASQRSKARKVLKARKRYREQWRQYRLNGMQFSPRKEGEERLKAIKQERRLQHVQIHTMDNSQVDGVDEGPASVSHGLREIIFLIIIFQNVFDCRFRRLPSPPLTDVFSGELSEPQGV